MREGTSAGPTRLAGERLPSHVNGLVQLAAPGRPARRRQLPGY
jgi:hypothetical protein